MSEDAIILVIALLLLPILPVISHIYKKKGATITFIVGYALYVVAFIINPPDGSCMGGFLPYLALFTVVPIVYIVAIILWIVQQSGKEDQIKEEKHEEEKEEEK